MNEYLKFTLDFQDNPLLNQSRISIFQSPSQPDNHRIHRFPISSFKLSNFH